MVVPVSNGIPLTDAATDSGAIASGVKSVSYYYCAGNASVPSSSIPIRISN